MNQMHRGPVIKEEVFVARKFIGRILSNQPFQAFEPHIKAYNVGKVSHILANKDFVLVLTFVNGRRSNGGHPSSDTLQCIGLKQKSLACETCTL